MRGQEEAEKLVVECCPRSQPSGKDPHWLHLEDRPDERKQPELRFEGPGPYHMLCDFSQQNGLREAQLLTCSLGCMIPGRHGPAAVWI